MNENNTRSTSAPKKIEQRKVLHFVGEVKQELKKVDWTSSEELRSYTKIVLLSTALFGFFVYFIDLLIQGVLQGINFFVKFITG